MERLGARICEPMARSGGNIDRFILRQHAFFVAYRHLCVARNHNPMFGTMVVKLQGQRFAGVDDDLFGLESLADVGGFIASPRPKDDGGQQMPAAAAGFQGFHNEFDVLRAPSLHDQRQLTRRNHHIIVSDNRDGRSIVNPDKIIV